MNAAALMAMAMDVVQKQMLELNDKVDTLHRLLEQLTDKVGMIATLQSSSFSNDLDLNVTTRAANLSPMGARRQVDPMMVHKDVLSDEPSLDGDKSSSPHNLSPEIQIQRLTAQLTAAYNRMAALEEQILACRFQ